MTLVTVAGSDGSNTLSSNCRARGSICSAVPQALNPSPDLADYDFDEDEVMVEAELEGDESEVDE